MTQGPEVAAFEREFAAYVGAPHACAVSSCTTALHLALADRRRAPWRRGDHGQPLLHRHRQRRPLLRRAARSSWTSSPTPSTSTPPGSRRSSRRAPGRSSCVHQIGMPCDLPAIVELARAPRAGRGRGRGVRHRQRDRVEGPLGEDRPAARRRRLLLLPPAQAGLDRRRRDDHDRATPSGTRRSASGGSTA